MNIEHMRDNLFLVSFEGGRKEVFACRTTNLGEAETEIAAMLDDLAAPEKVTASDIKAEAERRILRIAPEWRQRNAIARGLELLEKRDGGTALTAAEEAERAAIQGMWSAIKAIRARSDELERTLPDDYQDDARWP